MTLHGPIAPARMPVETAPRIAPIATLPLFHRLTGRRVVIAGGSEGALWKAELLSAAGADVLVLAGDQAARFADLVAAPVSGPVQALARDWTPADLEGAALALGDIADRGEADRFIAAARTHGAPVNMVDQTELCDVLFGVIVNRSPVVIGISTDGAAPMLGQSIRTRIEAVLPAGLATWAAAAQRWRARLKGDVADFHARRGFWGRFTRHAWSAIDRAPDDDDYDRLVVGGEAPGGSVTLVGAGPGDPELMTMKAIRVLQSATVILYDDLVGPDILELARREARRVAVGKTGHGPSCRQSDICGEIVRLARAGETVVRLKGGDPLIFGRATEEIDACRDAGVAVSVVPGITAAQGVAASFALSLTERHAARRVQFVTGHGSDGRLPDDIDWHAIADPVATTVVYMPRRTLPAFVAAAVAAGLDPRTPALAVASATRAEQAHVAASIATLADRLDALAEGAPVSVIIGQVVRGLVEAPVYTFGVVA